MLRKLITYECVSFSYPQNPPVVTCSAVLQQPLQDQRQIWRRWSIIERYCVSQLEWRDSPYCNDLWLLAEVPAVSLAGWRFGTQRPRFFSVDYRPTEAHSRDLRTGHLRFLSGDHSTPITLRCHFHTEQSGYSTFRVFSFRLRPFIGLHYVTSLEIHRIFLVVFPLCAISVLSFIRRK